MKKWTDKLSNDVYERLCNCMTKKSDIQELVNTEWLLYKEIGKDKKGFTKEDALVSVLELLDYNNLYIDLTEEEYDNLIAE